MDRYIYSFDYLVNQYIRGTFKFLFSKKPSTSRNPTVSNCVYTKVAYEFEVTGWQELVLESSDEYYLIWCNLTSIQ